MTDEEKMLWMFNEVHGKITGACYVEVGPAFEDDDAFDPELYVHLMKDGNICWSKSKAELVFDYITKPLDDTSND